MVTMLTAKYDKPMTKIKGGPVIWAEGQTYEASTSVLQIAYFSAMEAPQVIQKNGALTWHFKASTISAAAEHTTEMHEENTKILVRFSLIEHQP